MRPGLAIALLLAAQPASVIACDTAVNPAISEGRVIEASTLLYRGVIEDLRSENGIPSFSIRHVRTFWGSGAPERIAIPRAYFAECVLGNLQVLTVGNEPGALRAREGLGVTIIGRPEDFADPAKLIILVDGTDEAQRALRRFKELK